MDRSPRTAQPVQCHRDGNAATPAGRAASARPAHALTARYPSLYGWLILAGTLDIIVTSRVLLMGGAEVNPLAVLWLQWLGHWGLIALRYMSLLVVIGACELVGRRHDRAGMRLAVWAIVIATTPAALGLAQIAAAQARSESEPSTIAWSGAFE